MFTIAYTFQEFLGTELGSWLVSTGGMLVSAAIAVFVSKLRSKASIIAARDQQISEQSELIIRLSNTVEKLGQMFSLAFINSKGLTEEAKMAIATLAREIVTDVKSDASKLIDTALTKGKDALTKRANELVAQAEQKANELIEGLQIKTEIPHVDELT